MTQRIYSQADAARLLDVTRERVRQQLERHPEWIADHEGFRGSGRVSARGRRGWGADRRAGAKGVASGGLETRVHRPDAATMRAVTQSVARSVAARVRVVAARFPHRSRAEIARAFGVGRQKVVSALNTPRSPEVKEGWRAMLQWGATLEEIGTASHLSRERAR